MVVDARRLAGEVHQFVEQTLRLTRVQPWNVVRVAADQQRLAAGLGVCLDQRTQRHRAGVKTVAAVSAAGLGLVAELGLAVVQRVVRGQGLDLGAQPVVERVIGRAHVGKAGLAAGSRHHLGAEHRALGLHRHVGAVGMPAHVAFEDLDDIVVVGLDAQRAVGPDVADRCHVELKRPEAPGKADLLVARQVLTGKDQQRMLEPGLVQFAPAFVIDRGQADACDHGAERGVYRCDVEAGHGYFPNV